MGTYVDMMNFCTVDWVVQFKTWVYLQLPYRIVHILTFDRNSQLSVHCIMYILRKIGVWFQQYSYNLDTYLCQLD